ncbi:MAG TPA: methyltransferase domain-containing protein [Candidatus Nanoarchaeia archaeon]|nr:methyltransferase domain-containing protein [Candidatus Nanoarchaeia archaeon]
MVYKSWQKMKGKNVPSTSHLSERILEYLRPKSAVLDLGCGFGRLSGFFDARGFEVYGIDINDLAIEEAKRNEELQRVRFSVQDATNTNFTNDFFCGIVSQAVLACMSLEDRKKVLRECCRVLEPRGVIQIAEFGLIENKEEYFEHAKITGEYGTVIVKNQDDSEKFRTHNFAKEELESLITEVKLQILHYENPDFITISKNQHPGHIFICQKSDYKIR